MKRDKDIPVVIIKREEKGRQRERERKRSFTRKMKKLPVNRPFKIISRSGKKEKKPYEVNFITFPGASFVCFSAVCSSEYSFLVPEARNYSGHRPLNAF